MWATFFQDGGWGMYPTTGFGLLLVAASVLLVLRPEPRRTMLVASLGVVTFASGLLGTSVGVVNSFHYLSQVPKAEQLEIATLGCAESLNNLVLALIIVVLAGLIASLASLRLRAAGAGSGRSL